MWARSQTSGLMISVCGRLDVGVAQRGHQRERCARGRRPGRRRREATSAPRGGYTSAIHRLVLRLSLTSSHTARCSATFASRSVRTATIVVRSAWRGARPSAGRKPSRSVGLPALVAAAVQRGGVGEVEPVRRGDVLDEVLALAGHRQEVEDAAAVVVEDDDRELEAEPRGGDEPAEVVDRARRRRSGAPRPVRSPATPKAVETVPSMPLAPRLASTRGGRSRAGKNVSTSRTGIEEATTTRRSGGQRAPSSAATRGSLRPAGRGRARSPPRRRGRRAPAVEPAAVAQRRSSRSRRAWRAGRRRGSSPPRRPGPARRSSGSKAIWRRRRGRAATRAAAWRSAGRRRAARGRAVRAAHAGSRSSAS